MAGALTDQAGLAIRLASFRKRHDPLTAPGRTNAFTT
jgi:hypothetical protein